jgi:DNA-binding HxlR family transcriptional regulator
MLTTTLRGLERDGRVTRTVFPTIPPRVDDELTEMGRELQEPIRAFSAWARANIVRIDAARERFDANDED